MTFLEIVAVLLAGVGAGTINAVVGSGTLITFPTLLALGVPPVTANMSNSLGLVPGSIAGAFGYRRELAGQRERVLRLLVFSTAGGLLGAVLLLVLPPGAFEAVVPVLILLGISLVILQPRLSRAVADRAQHREQGAAEHSWWVPAAVFATGAYGGYFGAAQGVLLMGVLGIGVAEALQRLNGVKNVLVAVVNGVAGLVFVVVAELGLLGAEAKVDWLLVLLIAVGSVCGGLLGSAVGRHLPPLALRAVIVTVGLVAVVVLVS
ncbi:sulfite exporter TauE/SafE family protein [Nocardioides daeguensis]|uniref:Probable membrane transporter protein n=1 Tax=Nocardioides daeguensis TaxID=908359 RepID=A0ABP6W2E5_9ACTN|nr:sulfite exporter TauE/SafE family protein [Nocardioides daeguensis]MBV6726669.1 sulfite exporter TauE/SafE family protein [Nocardioides daeguensis]MCR1774579.1 sulfite exporter TauE/SafE family protein [Nocardioides daeguensis]